MKKIRNILRTAVASAVLLISSGSMKGQWTATGPDFYLSPVTASAGIGINPPAYKLHVVDDNTSATNNVSAAFFDYTSPSNGPLTYYGVQARCIDGGPTNGNTNIGVEAIAGDAGSATNTGDAIGFQGTATNVGSGNTYGGNLFGTGGTTAYGVKAVASVGTANNYGVYGSCGGSGGTNINAGVYGFLGNNDGALNAAIYGDANGFSGGTDWAAYFVGRTYHSSGTWVTSDLRFKKNVQEIKNAKAMLLRLNSYSYQFKRDEFPKKSFDEGTHFGLIAQELKEIFPELVTEEGTGYYAVNYQEMIPLLLCAFKEQQQEIQDLKNQNSSQKQDPPTGIEQLSHNTPLSVEQNIPNPFTHETTIQFSLAQSVNNAQLLVYDLAGKQIVTLPVNERGSSSLNFSAKNFAAGIYLYAIEADGKMSDTKRMVIADK